MKILTNYDAALYCRLSKDDDQSGETVDGVEYNYLTLDGKVVRQTWKQNNDEKVFDIIYDANGQPYACVYEGYRYYYVLNQQGDVIQIVGSEGTVCAEYRYDAWGNVLSITGLYAGTLGAVNPIRYRGYYYDTETGFYYLQSRYYDPSISRFINADQFASTGQDFLGYNMFAYCNNNPVTGFDPTGLVNWGGICWGIGIGILAVGAMALTVATAGAASPLVAGVVTTAGTVASGALIEASAVTTIGAWNESTVVYDATCIAGNDRVGCSYVYDFSENDSEWYLHTGKQSKSELGFTFGSGFVFNYKGEGSYGGTFVDVSKSRNYKGASLGVDYCTSPDNFTDGYTSCHALLFTSGWSTSFDFSKKPTIAYDYYWPI